MEKLDEYVTKFRADGLCEIDILRDMNIDLYTRTPRMTMYNRWLRQVGLENIITEATHIKNMGMGFSMIDHYLTTDSNLFQTSECVPTSASDHFNYVICG